MKKNGYRPTHRNKWLLLRGRLLSPQALLLLEFCIDQMDFDPRHTQFGTCEINFYEVAELFGCKSTTTPRNWHKQLLDRGFLTPSNKRGYYFVSSPERYIVRRKDGVGKADICSKEETNQPIERIIQSITQDFQYTDYSSQSNDRFSLKSLRNPKSKALGSSKVGSRVDEASTQDYQQTDRSNKDSSLSHEDIQHLNSPEYLKTITPIQTNKLVQHLTNDEVKRVLC